jgi:hypothetical protein
MQNKTGFIIGGGVLVVLIVLYCVFQKKMKANQNLSSGKVTDDKALAEAIERIYILETANYTSNIFKQTNGAGIVAFGTSYPFGWNMLEKFWSDNPDLEPVDFYFSSNGLSYLKFPSILAGQKAVGEIIKYRVGRGQSIGAYYSLVEADQKAYLKKLLSLKLPDSDVVRPNKYLV